MRTILRLLAAMALHTPVVVGEEFRKEVEVVEETVMVVVVVVNCSGLGVAEMEMVAVGIGNDKVVVVMVKVVVGIDSDMVVAVEIYNDRAVVVMEKVAVEIDNDKVMVVEEKQVVLEKMLEEVEEVKKVMGVECKGWEEVEALYKVAEVVMEMVQCREGLAVQCKEVEEEVN